MMIVLHPTYTLRVELQDRELGSRRFAKDGKMGCDEVAEAVREALKGIGIPYTVSLERFEHKS